MSTTPEHDKRMAELTFAEVYPHMSLKSRKKEEQRKNYIK